MASEAKPLPTPQSDHPRRVGVIDVGSNSIRLVVYDALTRTPLPYFNEKVMVGLGRDLDRTKRLDSERVSEALEALERFAELARIMRLEQVDVVATAAVREAQDGREFVREVERRSGLKVRVLSGTEEAELSALGVVSAIPGADGIMGDIGGSSVELVELVRGVPREQVTLPLGPFRLAESSAQDAKAARRIVDGRFESLDWLPRGKGRHLYLVGGNWRALARLHMEQTDYPIRVIHHYRLALKDALALAGLVARLSTASLKRLRGVARERRDALPLAALVLERLLRVVEPEAAIFSAYGLREGVLYRHWDASVRARDPLIDACITIAEINGQAPEFGFALHDWMSPLFESENEEERRLRLAACLLCDLAWREHPDYRAEHAYLRVLRLPVVGIDHPGRVFLALAAAARYPGGGSYKHESLRLLEEERRMRARGVGLAVRLGDNLAGKSSDALRHTAIRRDGDRLILKFKAGAPPLLGESVRRRLEALAELLQLEAVVEEGPRAGPAKVSGRARA